MPKPKVNRQKKLFIILAFLLGTVGLLYFFKDKLVVAWVNGRPISRAAYVNELDKLAKNQALDSLLTKKLIFQEAARQKINVSPEEIDAAIKNIEERAKEQGADLETLLTAQGISKNSLLEEVRLQKLLEKLVGEVSIGAEQVQTYFADNQKALYSDKKLEEVQEEIETQLKQQEMISRIQELIAKLQTEAKVVKWLN